MLMLDHGGHRGRPLHGRFEAGLWSFDFVLSWGMVRLMVACRDRACGGTLSEIAFRGTGLSPERPIPIARRELGSRPRDTGFGGLLRTPTRMTGLCLACPVSPRGGRCPVLMLDHGGHRGRPLHGHSEAIFWSFDLVLSPLAFALLWHGEVDGGLSRSGLWKDFVGNRVPWDWIESGTASFDCPL